MEFLLLWADNIDDAVGALRHLAPKVLALLAAISLCALTGIALVHAPEATLAAIGLVLSVSLVETIRQRRAQLEARQGSGLRR
jgi:hypothetical protein